MTDLPKPVGATSTPRSCPTSLSLHGCCVSLSSPRKCAWMRLPSVRPSATKGSASAPRRVESAESAQPLGRTSSLPSSLLRSTIRGVSRTERCILSLFVYSGLRKAARFRRRLMMLRGSPSQSTRMPSARVTLATDGISCEPLSVVSWVTGASNLMGAILLLVPSGSPTGSFPNSSASLAIASALVLWSALRKAHWSGSVSKRSSTKTLLPLRTASPWSGSAMRLPRSPSATESCRGKSRSYERKLTATQASRASETRPSPTRLASDALTGPSKNTHTWAPLPERERSTAGDRPCLLQASRYADAASCQPGPSKSAARKWQTSPSTT